MDTSNEVLQQNNVDLVKRASFPSKKFLGYSPVSILIVYVGVLQYAVPCIGPIEIKAFSAYQLCLAGPCSPFRKVRWGNLFELLHLL